MNSLAKGDFVHKTTIVDNLIKLVNDPNDFTDVIKPLPKEIKDKLVGCIEYSCNLNHPADKQEIRSFEIDFILAYLDDELNTGHWSKVPMWVRQTFTIASFVKSLILLKSHSKSDVNILKDVLKCVDMGILMGAPLEHNKGLLTESANTLTNSILTHDSAKKCDENCTKLCDDAEISPASQAIYRNIFGREIDVLKCPSMEHFKLLYFDPQVPLRITDCMNHWPARHKWGDINYLLEKAGDRTVPIEIGSHYTDENWSQKLMTLRDFIKTYYTGQSEETGYLAQHNLFDQITGLREDIRVPEYCCLSQNYEETCEPDINCWFGPSGTVSPMHFDPKQNILAQVFGYKQILLFSPKDTEFLYPHEGKMLSNTSQVDPIFPNYEEHPLFRKAKMFKCLLGPGEMLFIPEKWWHHVVALDKSFSVSFWWK